MIVDSTEVEDEESGGLSLVAVPLIQLVSRITVDTEQGTKTVNIATHFTPAFSLLTFEADMRQLLVVTPAALNLLARGTNLGMCCRGSYRW